MSPERWERVKEVFAGALERAGEERARHLAAACGEDASLRREVESLLAAHEQVGSFIDRPAGAPPALVGGRSGAARAATTLNPGERLGRYEIVALVGAGGMGQVYQARDLVLRRDVAVKVLPAAMASEAGAVDRFTREARAVAALNHPNILAIHDVGIQEGTPFAVMELLEGQTLRRLLGGQPLPPARALKVAADVAEGLAAAHGRGVVHRDLKPENVFVTADGRVKILDFGLARMTGPGGGGAPEDTETRTEAGVVMGTLEYMSPEQARGEEVDGRSDIFSFGCVLYEMLTGRPPFRRGTAAGTLSAILHEDPLERDEPRRLPPALRSLLRRCLEKTPGERYQSTRDLAFALEQAAQGGRPRAVARVVAGAAGAAAVATALVVASREPRPPAPPSGRPPSVAVLSLRDLSNDPAQRYFGEGLAEAITTDLARTPGLLVLARSSAARYEGGVDVGTVGRELGVAYVLHGNLQKDGSRLRVQVQLTDTSTGYHLWADRYDRDLSDVFAVQDHIARSVAGALRLALGAGGPVPASPPTTSLEAYDAYLRGRYHFEKLEGGGAEAIAHLERAVALDPRFARAHAALADAYTRRFFYEDPARTWEEKAHAEVAKALELDPALAEAYLARGNLTWTWPNRFPHESAIRDYRRALALNPNLADAHVALGRVYGHIGLLDQSLDEFQQALHIAPGHREALARALTTRFWQHRYREVLAELESTPVHPRNAYVRAAALGYLGREEEARDVLRAHLDGHPEDVRGHSLHAVLLARAGDRPGARREIAMVAGAARNERGYSSYHHVQYNVGLAWAVLGEGAQAVEWLRQAADEGFPCYPFYEKDPFLAGLKGQPVFDEFLRGLRARWDGYRAAEAGARRAEASAGAP